MPESGRKYQMVISRQTVDKLGIKLYDKVSAVLAELIANAYDADATLVTVRAPLNVYLASKVEGTALGHHIVVQDDGHGMTAEQVNRFYLKVGADRRADPDRGDVTLQGRKVMGRKGIGKLAPFGICREIEVVTAGGEAVPAKGYQVSDLILRLDGILQETDEPYYPDPGPLDETWAEAPGTRVILRDFDYRKVPDAETLHRQLAARFGLSRPDWAVRVHDSLAGGTFEVGALPIDVLDGTRIDVSSRPVVVGERALPLTGWVAYARSPYKDEVIAGVRIFARGKIVAQTRDFGVSSGFTGEYKLRSYLVGMIHADWLDEEEDLVRSDRQDILWNSGYGQALQEWGRKLVVELAARAETSLRRRVWEDFLEKSNLDERVAAAFPKSPRMRDSVLGAARSLLKGTDEAMLQDPDFIESLTSLALSIGPQQTLLARLHEIAATARTPFVTLVELFDSARVAEMYSLGQIAHERVRAVRRLEELVQAEDPDELELQRLIESAPWLIAPDWTPLSANKTLETFRRVFESWFQETFGVTVSTTAIGSGTRRPDFVLVNLRGPLHVVEIKKPRHVLIDKEYDRVTTYLEALTRFLAENPTYKEEFLDVRATVVCDSVDLRHPTNLQHLKLSSKAGIVSVRTWREFLHSTQRAHEDFLRALSGKEGQTA